MHGNSHTRPARAAGDAVRPGRSARGALLVLAAALAVTGWTARAGAEQLEDWPTNKVFVPTKLFKAKHAKNELDEAVRAANPRLYLYSDFDMAAKDKILIIGMPGWGGRSENFIWMLINGLRRPGLTKRLVVATIQDTATGGPLYQGQGDRAHANVWSLDSESVKVMRRFVHRLTRDLGGLTVYFLGFSSGGVAAPVVATRIARWSDQEPYSVGGSIALGTGSQVSAGVLKARKQRVLFVLVPKRKRADTEPIMRDDQSNRSNGIRSYERLKQQGAEVFLRHVESAKRHIDWHWGLVSNCRYFRTERIDPGRGYWPDYWDPNPESFDHVVAFIQGQEPPPGQQHPPTTCKVAGRPTAEELAKRGK